MDLINTTAYILFWGSKVAQVFINRRTRSTSAVLALTLMLQASCGTSRNKIHLLRQQTELDLPAEKPPTVGDHAKNAATAVTKVAAAVVLLPAVLIGALYVQKQEREEEEREEGRSFPNSLWRQGYGYNNPNNQRIQEGKPALNFDGTESK